MWRYRKPGFELLLLEELQRQQRSSELCDTILQADGICVPAHSCVLSAISPLFSHTLSTAAPLPLGQSHLLEFRTVRAHTLLKLVGLLYSGELEGSGEREREEVMTASWKLGIRGLEEVGREEGAMQEKRDGGVREGEKEREGDGGQVRELGKRREEAEGLNKHTDGTRGQKASPKDRQGVCLLTGVGDGGGEDQDVNIDSSFAALPKMASDSETQTEVSDMTVGRLDMETETQEFQQRNSKTDTGIQTCTAVWTDRETDRGTQTDIPVWMDIKTDTGSQTDLSVWMDRETDRGTQTDIPVWMDIKTDTGSQTDLSVWMDRETDRGTQTDIPVWMDIKTDTGSQTDIPVSFDRETDTGSQTDIPVSFDRETDTGSQTDIPVSVDRETDTGSQTDIPVSVDRETDTGSQADIPVSVDRETDTGSQADIHVPVDRETDTGSQTDIPVSIDRETDTGSQTDISVWLDGETDTGSQTDISVCMDGETDTGSQTDISVWMDRETDSSVLRRQWMHDGHSPNWPLSPMSTCSAHSSARADCQSTRFSIPLLPSVKPLAFCMASQPQLPSPESGGPPRDGENSLLSTGDLQGEGGAQLVNSGHVMHRHEACFVTVREGDHTTTLAGHTFGDAPLMNVSVDRSSSGPALAITNSPSSTVFPEAPFPANIAAETDANSHGVAPISALSTQPSDTVAPLPLIIAHDTDSFAPNSEILASDMDMPAAVAESASLVAPAEASGGSDLGPLSASEAACSTPSADLPTVAPDAEVMAQPCMALDANPRFPLPNMFLPSPSGECSSPPCIIQTVPQRAILDDPGGGPIRPSTSLVCILPQGLCHCPLIPAASPTLAQVEGLRQHKSSSFPPGQAEMDFHGAFATAQKNASFGSVGGRVDGDGVQGLDAEENGEFERFEGNIVGYINYFLNPKQSQEESAHAGVGKSNVTGLQEMAPSGPRKRGRRRKTAVTRTKVLVGEGERGNPSSLGRGRGRGRMKLRPRSPQKSVRRGWGRGGGGGQGMASFGGRHQPIKMRLKKQVEGGVWEIVDVRAEAFGAPGRRRSQRARQGAIGGQGHTQDAFPTIKRQRGQPGGHPLQISSLPSQVYSAVVSLPDHAQLSMYQAPFQSGCGWQRPLRTLPPPAAPQAASEESAEQFEKLLDDMVGFVMGLDANAEGVCPNGSAAAGSASLQLAHTGPSAGPYMLDMVSPGSCLPEVVISAPLHNVTPAQASEGDFAVAANPAPPQSVRVSPLASVPRTKTPLHGPHHGIAPSHGCGFSPLYSVGSHTHDEAAPCRERSELPGNPIAGIFSSEFGNSVIAGPQDSLLSCSSLAAGVTVSGSTCSLEQMVPADSRTRAGLNRGDSGAPRWRSGGSTDSAQSPVPSHSSGVSTDHSHATVTSPYCLPQETTTVVNDILERILVSFGNESQSQCVKDDDRPGAIVQEDGAEVQEEATTPGVLGEHLSKDTRDMAGSKGADDPLDGPSQIETQHLQEHGMPLTVIHSPVQTELTLEPEQPTKTSQDTSHIPVESQISSSATHSEQKHSKDLSCCPNPGPGGLQIPSLMTEHLPADSSPKRLESPVSKQPVPADCSERPAAFRGDKAPLGNRLEGWEKVDAQQKRRKIVTRSQTKRRRTKDSKDGKRRTSSNRRKLSAKRGLNSQTPMWERHVDGTVAKRLRRLASWCEEENIGKLHDGRFRPAEMMKKEGQTTGVSLRRASTATYSLKNQSSCSGINPGNFAVRREARNSVARVCFSCTEKSPLDKPGKLDRYVNRLASVKSLVNKPMRTEYGTNLTNTRYRKADGISKGGPSKRESSERMCKASLITRDDKQRVAKAGSELVKSTISCWKAQRCQVGSERKMMEDRQADQGGLHRRGRKRAMQDAMELKTRQGPPDKRRLAKAICSVSPQQRCGSLPQRPSPDLLQGRMKQRPKNQNPGLRDRKACAVRADSRLLHPSGVHNFGELLQCKSGVTKWKERENHRKERAESEEWEGREDCRDAKADGGTVGEDQNRMDREEVTVQDDNGHGKILESRAESTERETMNKERPTDPDGAYSTDGEVGGSGPSEMDGVDGPEAGQLQTECENDQETASPSGTEIQDVSMGDSVASGVAMASQMSHNVTSASVRCWESEGEVDVEVDVLECSSPTCVLLDTLYWSTAQGLNDAALFEVDTGEEDEEGEEVDVTGEDST